MVTDRFLPEGEMAKAPRDHQVVVLVDAQTRGRLERMSAEEDASLSALVRRMVVAALDARDAARETSPAD